MLFKLSCEVSVVGKGGKRDKYTPKWKEVAFFKDSIIAGRNSICIMFVYEECKSRCNLMIFCLHIVWLVYKSECNSLDFRPTPNPRVQREY